VASPRAAQKRDTLAGPEIERPDVAISRHGAVDIDLVTAVDREVGSLIRKRI
jgi:hypothetical protein